MTNIDKLISAINDGTLIGENLMVSRDVSEAMEDVAGESWGDVCSAYEGSLDAAKDLHEALLPKCAWFLESAYRGDEAEATIDGVCIYVTASSANPARAWLLAILSAYKTTLPT